MVSPREMYQRFNGKLKRERVERECQRIAAARLQEPVELLPYLRHVPQPQSAEPLPNPLRQNPVHRSPIESSSPESTGTPQDSTHSSSSHLLGGAIPEAQSAGKDGATPEGNEGRVIPKTPSLIVRAVAAGRRKSKSKSKSSAAKSADTQVEDPDAITLAPPPERKPTSSVSIGSTLLDSPELEVDLEECYMCGQKLGKPRVFDNKTEKTTFLPCGHAMGHECLFRWLADPDPPKRCPKCRVPLRHRCEHMTCPTYFPPKRPYGDKLALVLPFNYEFCKSPRGVRMLAEIKVAADKLRETETRWRDRRHTASGIGLAAVRLYHMFFVHQLEKRLDANHRAWWAVKWVEYGFGEARGFFSIPIPGRHRKGSTSQQASA